MEKKLDKIINIMMGIFLAIYTSFSEIRNGLAVAALMAVANVYPLRIALVLCVLFVWMPKAPRKALRKISKMRRELGASHLAYCVGAISYFVIQVGIATCIGISAAPGDRLWLAVVCIFCKYILNKILEEEKIYA